MKDPKTEPGGEEVCSDRNRGVGVFVHGGFVAIADLRARNRLVPLQCIGMRDRRNAAHDGEAKIGGDALVSENRRVGGNCDRVEVQRFGNGRSVGMS